MISRAKCILYIVMGVLGKTILSTLRFLKVKILITQASKLILATARPIQFNGNQ